MLRSKTPDPSHYLSEPSVSDFSVLSETPDPSHDLSEPLVSDVLRVL